MKYLEISRLLKFLDVGVLFGVVVKFVFGLILRVRFLLYRWIVLDVIILIRF